MVARVNAIEVKPGTLIVLHDVQFDPDDPDVDSVVMTQLGAAIADACGHRQFALLRTYGDGARVDAIQLQDAIAMVEAAVADEAKEADNATNVV